MAHLPINHDPEPIRLFKSDFLEFFTHISPITVIVIWLPVAVVFLWLAVSKGQAAGANLWYVPVAFLIGLFLWTPAEYLGHRFIFHFRPRSPRQEKIIFLFHGIHHAQPQCKTRLVMPLPVSIPMAFLFYGIFYLVVGRLMGASSWVYPLFSGFIIGYMAYDLIHYATHHFPMRSRYLRYLKRHHMRHHYKTPDQRYGVSSPLWDIVFSTLPKSS